MSLNCRVFRDEKGQIDFVNAPNGNRSKLFDTLVNITGGNKNTALNIYALTEVEELKSSVNAKINAFKERFKNIVKVAPSTSTRMEEIMFSKTASSNPTYYSNAISAINNLADKNPKNIQGWLKQLTDVQKNGGVRNVNQELEWIGLEDYLNNYVKENNPKNGNISFDVVNDYIQSNQIEIVDVNKGVQLDRNLIDPVKNKEGNWDILYKGKKIFTLDDYQAKDREEAIEVVLDADVTWDEGTTKYSGYQLKGGENYREVLLTMPNKEGKNPLHLKRDELSKQYREAFDSGNYDLANEIDNQISEITKQLQVENSINATGEKSQYKSSHWDEANILAHVRLNEKTLPDGRRVLIVNEIQSDWAQEGRSKGFVENRLRISREQYEAEEKAIEQEALKILGTTVPNIFELERVGTQEAIDLARRVEENTRQFLYLEGVSEKDMQKDKVAQMPYQNTDQWVGLATRRVLQMAAQEGYDGVAFATGQQSADMYSLSNQVDKINIEVVGEKRAVEIFQKGDRKDTVILNKEGIITSATSDVYKNKRAEDVLGKDLTNKILGTKIDTTLEGEGLEFGGEGMKTFYDKIVPKVAQKEAQRFDKNVKLEEVNFREGEPVKVVNKSNDADFPDYSWVDKYGNVIEGGFQTEEKALENKPKISSVGKLSIANQPFISITDKMRSELGKTIPLFSKTQGQEAPREVLDQVTDRLKQSGLASNVYQMSNSEIEAKLVELGVSSEIAKQVTMSTMDVTSVEFNPEEDFWEVYLLDGSYIEVYLSENTTEEEVKEEAIVLLKEYLLDSMPTVYRGINGEFSPNYKGVQYFAVNKRYAGVFGRNIEEFRLKSVDILDLDSWNKKWGVENVDFGQGLLTVHQNNLSNLEEWRDRIENSLFAVGVEVSKEEIDSFIKEVENAKIIKGEDIGNRGQIVFAVKDKSLVEPINKDIQFSKKGIKLNTAGFTYKGDVYLNSEVMGLDTPIHEFGHLHLDWLKENRNDLYKAGLSLIGKNKKEAQEYINIVKNTQPDLKEGTEKFNNEVLAQVIGDQGARLVNSKKDNSIADWLKNVWEAIKDVLGLSNYTADQVANMTLAEFGKASASDMLSGKNIAGGVGSRNLDVNYSMVSDGERKMYEQEIKRKEGFALSQNTDWARDEWFKLLVYSDNRTIMKMTETAKPTLLIKVAEQYGLPMKGDNQRLAAMSAIRKEAGRQNRLLFDTNFSKIYTKPEFKGNPDIDRIKSLEVEGNEDGATFNLDGSTYTGGGLVVPAISFNTTLEDLSKEAIEKFIEENQDKIGSNSVKVGLYKFKDSNQVSIDLNIVVKPEYRDIALAFGRFAGQESLFNLDTFENIPTGADGKNPKNFTSEEFRQISESLSRGEFPEFMNTNPSNSSNYANLTEDGKGNFVFYHVGKVGYDTIKRSSGATLATSRQEAQALSKVGGLAMYYTRPGDSESMVKGDAKYLVKVPMNKVYDFNTDILQLIGKARELHSKEHPGMAFDANTQVAYITKLAGELGYDMVVAEWDGKTRAQSIKELKPNDSRISEGTTVKKPFLENYESNTEKGFRPVIPVTKREKLEELYLALNDYRNRENRYDDIYRLNEEFTKLSQEEISNRINNSDLPQEYKDKYNSIIESPEAKRMSTYPIAKSVKREPSLELNGTKIFAKERVNQVTGEKLDGIEWELIESTERGKGNARKAAELFLNGTDAQGQDVYLTVSPRDAQTSAERLESFYSSLGFEKTSDFEMVRKARPISPKDLDSNGEVSVNSLMNFANSKVKPLSNEGLKAAKNTAMSLKVKTSKELIEKMEKALMKNGIVLFDKLSLQRSKLYNIFEINTILASPRLQKQIKESLLALRNSEPFVIEYDENFVVPQGREVNQFGKQEIMNPSIVEKELIDTVAGLEESEIDEALPSEFSNKYYTDADFRETVDTIAKNYKKAPVKTVIDGELVDKVEDVEGMLENTITGDSNESIADDIMFLRESIDEDIFNTKLKAVSKVLNKIKKNAYVNGIDLRNLPTLALELSRSEILGFLDSMEDAISNIDSEEDFKEFSERYYKILGDKEIKTETIKSESNNDVIVEDPLSEYEMFSKFGLVKKDDGIYRQVTEESLDTLYENFFEHKNLLPDSVETLEDLKRYVQKNASLLEISDYEVDVDNLEKIFLYKKFFDFPISTKSLEVSTDNFNKITNSEGYLTDVFVKDFNKWILATANPYFKVTGKGIELVNNDEISKEEAINSVPERFKQELAEYNVISKNLNLDLPLPEERYQDINTQLEQRQRAVNNPESVKKVSGQYTYLKDEVLAVKNESETFLRTPIGIFEKIFEFENIKFYGKLDTDSKKGYKKVSVEAPFSDINFKEYMYLANKPESFKESKNYYSRKELDDINDEYFGCQ